MKQYLKELLKECDMSNVVNRNMYIVCLICSFLQILGFLWKPFLVVELLLLIVLIIVSRLENSICYLFFLLPFYNVFRLGTGNLQFTQILSGFTEMYFSIWLLFVYIVKFLICYTIDVVKKNKFLNFRKIVIFLFLFFILIFPIDHFSISSLSTLFVVCALFVVLYLFSEYYYRFDIRNIARFWFVGILFSSFIYLFKDIIPQMSEYLLDFDTRFTCLLKDPNYWSLECLCLILIYSSLWFKGKVKHIFPYVITILSILALFSQSKAFLITYLLFLFLFFIACLIPIIREKSYKKWKKKRIIMISVCAIVLSLSCIILFYDKIEVVFARLLMSFKKKGTLYDKLNAITTNRWGIWNNYMSFILGSLSMFVFGRGVLRGYESSAIHNTPLQIFYFGGFLFLFSIIILLCYFLAKISKVKRIKIFDYFVIAILIFMSCSLDLLLSYRLYLVVISITLLFINNENKCDEYNALHNEDKKNSKIAIFGVNMCLGGVEKSLVQFSKILANKGIEIDLYLMNAEGPLLKDLHTNINVKEISELKNFATINVNKVMKKNWIRKILKWGYSLLALQSAKIDKIDCDKYSQEHYDFALVYQGLNAFLPEFVIKKINAKRKYVYIHADFSKNKGYSNINKYLKQFDKIITVSDSCRNPISKYLNYDISDIITIRNKIDEKKLLSKVMGIKKENSKVLSFVSVSRIVKEKAYLRTLGVLKRLHDEGYEFKYTIVGSGFLDNKLQKFITKNNMNSYVFRVEQTDNPFVYVKQSDCLLLLSYQEAAPLTINESFILKIPVITTRTISADEMVQDYGIVCDNSANAIYKILKEVLNNKTVLDDCNKKLKKFTYDSNSIDDEIINLFR